uniref:Signal recognition particle subunit SRP68 n=1 Tax=Timema shepardi TaxID=629360 RepID=A0A7R9B130_TIMSH|nr:unnamed protein product [Timema shepardi]
MPNPLVTDLWFQGQTAGDLDTGYCGTEVTLLKYNHDTLQCCRYLYIPLMMSERAWSYAMQLRQEANTEPRKKFHLVSRLRKATTYALQLQSLCESSKCDARSKLEAKAYVAWITGSLQFELQLWRPAMENLKNAQVVYEKLATALPEEDQILYKQRVEELSPSLRYCAYNIGDDGAMDDLLELRSHGQGDLLANLDTLMAQTRERGTEVVSEVEWRGRSVPAKPERVRLFLLSEKEAEKSLKRASDKHREDCSPGNTPAKARTGPLSSLQYLLSYLTYIRLTRTIQRNLLMVDSAKTALADRNDVSMEGRKTRPQDLTRLYEIILQNYAELQQLPGLEDDLTYQQELEAEIKSYRAFRCFYIAQSLASMRRWPEAMALYHRSEQYAKEATKGAKSTQQKEFTALLKDIEGEEFCARAHSVLDQEEDAPGPARSNYRTKKPLSEHLGEYREDPSLLSKTPNVYKLPPDMQPIPCKPLFFDLAFNFAGEFPDLQDKLDTAAGKKAGPAGLTGFVKGLWGWGGK